MSVLLIIDNGKYIYEHFKALTYVVRQFYLFRDIAAINLKKLLQIIIAQILVDCLHK